MTMISMLTFATALVIGFSVGRIYVYRQLRQTLNLEKQYAMSDTPIGDALAHELNIILAKFDAGDRA